MFDLWFARQSTLLLLLLFSSFSKNVISGTKTQSLKSLELETKGFNLFCLVESTRETILFIQPLTRSRVAAREVQEINKNLLRGQTECRVHGFTAGDRYR